MNEGNRDERKEDREKIGTIPNRKLETDAYRKIDARMAAMAVVFLLSRVTSSSARWAFKQRFINRS